MRLNTAQYMSEGAAVSFCVIGVLHYLSFGLRLCGADVFVAVAIIWC